MQQGKSKSSQVSHAHSTSGTDISEYMNIPTKDSKVVAFGVRQMAAQDGSEDEDFFEFSKIARPSANLPRSILRKPASPDPRGKQNLNEMERPSPKTSVSQLPAQSISIRDGTLALSQTSSFYEADFKSKNIAIIQSQPLNPPIPQPKQLTTTPLQPAPPAYSLRTLRHPPPSSTSTAGCA